MTTRLYLITPPRIEAGFSVHFEEALSAGDVAAVQLRLKPADPVMLATATRQLMPIAHKYGAAFIINDDAQAAHRLGADGCHIGQHDMPYAMARNILGDARIIGVTCHDSRHLAMEAGEAGANYVAFGSFYPSTTKMSTSRPTPSILRWWQEVMEIPCIAIGGITSDNASILIDAGADFLAVSSGVWAHPAGAAQAVAQFTSLFAKYA